MQDGDSDDDADDGSSGDADHRLVLGDDDGSSSDADKVSGWVPGQNVGPIYVYQTRQAARLSMSSPSLQRNDDTERPSENIPSDVGAAAAWKQ